MASSIRDFLLSKIDTEGAQMNQLAVDMLSYGAAAQLCFDYDTENLVTQCLTEAQLAYGTQGLCEATYRYAVSGDGVNVSMDIVTGATVALNLSCIAADLSDPSAVRCIVSDENGTIPVELASERIEDYMFSAKYDDIGAGDMRKLITATFFEGDEPISKTVRWSVESYVAQLRADPDAAPEEVALANAMLAYGDSAAAYLAANE